MGWLFGWNSRKELVEELRRDLGDRLIDEASTAYGKRWWTLVRSAGDGTPVIVLFLLNGNDRDWGYKDVDECMGPYEVDCPMRLIKAAGPPINEFSAAWRWRAVERHLRRKRIAGLEPGTIVHLAGRRLKLLNKRGRKWLARREPAPDIGGFFEICPRHYAGLTIVEETL